MKNPEKYPYLVHPTYLCAHSPTAANQSPRSGHSSVGAWCLENRFHADENNPPVLAASGDR